MLIWKHMFAAGYKYVREFKVCNGKCMKERLNEFELYVTGLLMVFFHFKHPVLILAAVLHAWLYSLLRSLTTIA
jgi:hypothetical protein